MTFAISGRRRPKRSASMPKMIAPTGRKSSVAVNVLTIWRFGTPKCAASTSSMKTTTKKSKASRVQPRKPAMTAWRDLLDGMMGQHCKLRGLHNGRCSPEWESHLVQAPRGADVSSHDAEERHARAGKRRP